MDHQVRIGVLVMSYGSPATLDEIESYYTHVRRGHPPSPEQLADLRRRYEAIGGLSPLAQRSLDQAQGLQAKLDSDSPGHYRVALGSKHAAPFIEDAVAELASAGVSSITTLVMAPHFSSMSVGEYTERAKTAAARFDLGLLAIPNWHTEACLIELLAQRLTDTLGRLPDEQSATAPILFTAHSLPARVLGIGDPYVDQVIESAQLVARHAGIAASRVQVAWQSAGRTSEPWLGPDLGSVIQSLANGGAQAVVVCPVGFTSDHLEILYDLDIEARDLAHSLGLVFVRTESLNADSAFMAGLAAVVRRVSSHAPSGTEPEH